MQFDLLLLKLGDVNSPCVSSLLGILGGGDGDSSPGRLPCALLNDSFFLIGLDRFCTSPERQIKRNCRRIIYLFFPLKHNNEWACLHDRLQTTQILFKHNYSK